MRTLIGWNSMLYQSTDARSNLWRHSAHAGKLKTFLAHGCKVWIKLVFLQISLQMWAKTIL